MKPKTLSLKLISDRMAVCCFNPTAAIPNWIGPSASYSVIRTDQELTIVCAEAFVAQGTSATRVGNVSRLKSH